MAKLAGLAQVRLMDLGQVRLAGLARATGSPAPTPSHDLWEPPHVRCAWRHPESPPRPKVVSSQAETPWPLTPSCGPRAHVVEAWRWPKRSQSCEESSVTLGRGGAGLLETDKLVQSCCI